MLKTKVTHYCPKEGCDIVVKVMQDGQNLSAWTALQIHKAWTRECVLNSQPRCAFMVNITYRFASGLVFRLFDSGLEDGNEAIEFLARGNRVSERRRALSSIVDLLLNCDIARSDLDGLVPVLEKVANSKTFVEG